MGRGHALGGGPRVRIAALVVLVLALALTAVAAAAPPTWLAAQDLAGGPSASPPPQVATDAAGDAFAVWEGYDATSLSSIIQAATRPAAGDAVAAWVGSDGSNFVIQGAVRPAGEAWDSAHNLSAAGQDALQPRVALDQAGDAAAVWVRFNGSNYIAQAAGHPAGGSWGSPESVSAGGTDAAHPQVALDSAGNAVALWDESQTNDVVQAAVRAAGAIAWSA